MTTNPTVIPLPRPGGKPKTVRALQAAIDALPPGSGDWRVEGVIGLSVRVGPHSKSFRLQRRIGGRLVVRVLGPMSL